MRVLENAGGLPFIVTVNLAPAAVCEDSHLLLVDAEVGFWDDVPDSDHFILNKGLKITFLLLRIWRYLEG